MSDAPKLATRDAEIPNRNGLHSRPVMSFIDLASTFSADITVTNVTRNGVSVDGKSAMEMMLLEATQGCILRIQAQGDDADRAVDALAHLVGGLSEADAD